MKLISLQIGNQNIVTQQMKKTFHQWFSVWRKVEIHQGISFCCKIAERYLPCWEPAEWLTKNDLHNCLADPAESVCWPPPLPAWNSAKRRRPSQLQSPLQVYTWWKAQCGEQTCGLVGSAIVWAVLKIDGQAFNLYSISCSEPGDLRLTAWYWNFHSRWKQTLPYP